MPQEQQTPSFSEQEQIRRAKLAALREAGLMAAPDSE